MTGAETKLYEKTESGPLRWMAPESVGKSRYSHKSDVYSFAITILEIVTRTSPFPSMNKDQVLNGLLSGTINPPAELPTHATQGLRNLVKHCTERDPTERLDFETVVELLNDLNFKLYE